jgi:outer membrane lipopolysaccharide assembly protein LptE/RlpB
MKQQKSLKKDRQEIPDYFMRMTYILRLYSSCLFLLLLLFISGCGIYSVRPGTIPTHIKSIAVSPVVNETAEFAIAEDMTGRLLNQLLTENLLPLADENDANSIIYVTIKNLDDKPYTFDEQEMVKEYKLTISADFTWYDAINQDDLMKSPVTQWSAYYSDNYNSQFSPDDQRVRETALNDAMTKIAEDIILKLTSDW